MLESETRCGCWTRTKLETTAAARASPASTTAAFTRLVAIPAKHRAIAARLKRHCCRLAATRTNHRCSLCWSRTVAGAPLVVFLCLTAILATLRGRITTFLKERLIRSGEGKILPAIAARKLNISGHGSPRRDCTAHFVICVQVFPATNSLWRKSSGLDGSCSRPDCNSQPSRPSYSLLQQVSSRRGLQPGPRGAGAANDRVQ